jgi:sugar lactone lactonase YvrE
VSEEWSSAQAISSYNARCKLNDPSSSTIVPATGDLLVICTEAFGPGPYAVNRLSGIANDYAAVDSFSYDLTSPFMIPESLTFQPSTNSLLYSSYSFGGVYSTFNPSVDLTSGYSATTGSIKKIVSTGVTALGLQVDPKYDQFVWGTYSDGIYRANTAAGTVTQYPFDTSRGVFYNDVTIDRYDGTVYSTDMGTDHKIEAHTPADRTGATSTITTTTIATGVCVDCSTTCSSVAPGYCGPNGLALISNGNKKAKALVTGAFSYNPASVGLFRVDIATGTKTRLTVVPDTFVVSPDGMRFDDEGEFLFVAAYGTDTVTAYYSCDGWTSTVSVAGVFKGGCPDGSNTAVEYLPNGDLVIACADDFGPGPYPSTRITGIRSRLLGVSYSSIEDFCEGDDLFDLDDEDDEDSDEDDEDDEKDNLIIALSVLTAIFGVTALVFLGLFFIGRKGQGSSDSAIAVTSPTKNALQSDTL